MGLGGCALDEVRAAPMKTERVRNVTTVMPTPMFAIRSQPVTNETRAILSQLAQLSRAEASRYWAMPTALTCQVQRERVHGLRRLSWGIQSERCGLLFIVLICEVVCSEGCFFGGVSEVIVLFVRMLESEGGGDYHDDNDDNGGGGEVFVIIFGGAVVVVMRQWWWQRAPK